jgi:16S rRNA (cytosine967-C5)-methyltransferase
MNASQGLLARQAAVALLEAVLRRNQALDEALASAFSEHPFNRLEPRDRAFARLIAATTLRRLGQIDAVVKNFQTRRLPPRAGAAQNILRAAAAQILFLGTPAHAAVSSAVALAQADKGAAHYKGLLNAVLRRVAAEGQGLVAAQDAVRLNTPQWLWEGWRKDYGENTARAIAAAHLKEPPLDLRARGDAAALAEKMQAQLLPTGSLRLDAGGRIEDLPGFAEGEWWVQDMAAALPARLLGDVAGKPVLDLCAAPGGKTAQLAAAGAKVTAIDRSAKRMGLVRENLSRLKLDAHCVTADAVEWRPESPVRLILLDAPCSATGTIRRHPDAAWRKTAKQVEDLTALQDRLLDAASAMLAPGGLLVYCVCSLQPQEGPARIANLLARDGSLERAPLEEREIGGLSALISPEGDLRSLPCHLEASGGMDGFFAARLRKK